MKSKYLSIIRLAASFSMLCSMPAAYGELLYQWNFNGGDGSNTGSGTGGTLTANVGAGATTGSFTQTGPSGEAWDHSLHTSNAFDNWWGSDIGNAAGVGNLDLSSVNQFTITMWIKRTGGNIPSLLNIGDTATPSSTSNPGISLGFDWGSNNLRFGVKGYNGWAGDLWGKRNISNQWVFVAVSYDGNGGVWYDETMNALYGQHRNAVVITGDPSTPATVATGLPMHIGDWGTAVGSPALGATATAFLANNGSNTTGFSGNMDDVRIYNGLLTVAQIEAIRQDAFAEPSPPVELYWKGDVDENWTSLNWTSDIDGTVPGGALATDGSAGVAFATTGAANLSTLLGADQSVRNIVVKDGSGPIDISGTHSLTLGTDGIWLEQTAGALYIYPSGGVILAGNQIWKNKSTNPLVVDSALSGGGTLTKSGTGTLRLGGDNSARTAGTFLELGTLALDHANALGGSTASLAVNSGTLDLNGKSVTLGALSGNNSGVIHNSLGTPCSLTLDLAADCSYACKINDGPGGVPVSLVKKGSATVTSNSAGDFTGPVTIENGQFIAMSPNWGAPNSGSLGNAQVPGRTITVTYPGTLALNYNNIFGNQAGDPAKLPEVIVNETSLSATNYNLIGPITLNAATLSHSTTETGNYQGYQFKGTVKVTGTTGASNISGAGANHLSSNTVFEVENATGDETEDLIVSARLINQSGDFALAAGGLTKTGAGTMALSAANTYTGNTVVSEGILALASAGLSDTATTEVAAGAKLVLNFTGEDSVGALVLDGVSQPVGIYGAVDSGAEHESAFLAGDGLLNVIGLDPYDEWIANYPSLIGAAALRAADPDGDGRTNIQEFAFNSAPDDGTASGKIQSAVATVESEQALVLTLPVRNGAVFSGTAPASATLVDEQLTYQIGGANDLASFDQAVSEVTPALSSGLPALDDGWSYRTFRLSGNVGGATPRGPQGFLRAAVVDNAP